jgi:hypothetical protein
MKTFVAQAGFAIWPNPPLTVMPAMGRGAFILATRSIASRRTHLPSELGTVWKQGRLLRLSAQTRCGRFLTSVSVIHDVPDEYELCDDCVLSDFAPFAVYRLRDTQGRLLYIGCTTNLHRRLMGHASQSDWWRLVQGVTWDAYSNHVDAARAEAAAIVDERPLFNRDLTDRAKRPARRRPTERVA